jgi:bacterioferritin-associated ferredoxin
MYVCICAAVTDREIVRQVERGADSLEQIRFELGVATCCGQCADCARQLIDETLASARPSTGASAAAGITIRPILVTSTS